MPVNTPRREYEAHRAHWRRCRDCFDGADAVKARKTEYLPMLSGQDDGSYTAYLTRADFHNAYARTVAALAGVLFRKPPSREAPKAADRLWKDVTRAGVDLDTFVLGVAEEVFKVGRHGLLLDTPDAVAGPVPAAVPGTPVVAGDPFWAGYTAESILSWTETRVGGVPVLTRVILSESRTVADETDPYVQTEVPAIRELALIGGQYVVQMWKQTKAEGSTKVEWVRDGAPKVPMRRGKALPFIPFVFVNPAHLAASPHRPPLLDLADLNLSHYRTSADLEHGRHFTALPTPWITGYAATEPMTIGSEKAWTLANENAKVGMLEFTGSGLGALVTAQEHKEQQMAAQGARLLEMQKAGVEAADTVRMRHAGDDATLRVVSTMIAAAVSRMMRWACWWANLTQDAVDDTVTYSLGVDFFSMRMDPAELQALVAAMQHGAMSFDTFYYLLQRGDMTRPGIDAEAERHAIDKGDDTADDAEDDDAEPELDDEGKPVPPKPPTEDDDDDVDDRSRLMSDSDREMERKTMATKYKVGDRVKIKPGKNHDAMTKDKVGTVKEISTEALGIKFDGMTETHKWYVDDEVQSA